MRRSTTGRRVRGPTGRAMFSSSANGGDPETPLAPELPGRPDPRPRDQRSGQQQMHSFSLGGLSWLADPGIPNSEPRRDAGSDPDGRHRRATSTTGLRPSETTSTAISAGRSPSRACGVCSGGLDSNGCPIMGIDGRILRHAASGPDRVRWSPRRSARWSRGTPWTAERRTRPMPAASRACSSSSTASTSARPHVRPVHDVVGFDLGDGRRARACCGRDQHQRCLEHGGGFPIVVDNTAPDGVPDGTSAGATVSGAAIVLAADANDNNASPACSSRSTARPSASRTAARRTR